MWTILLAFALSASAQSGLDMIKPAEGMTPRKRVTLACRDADSIRDFKAAVVRDSGWEHKRAEDWARCVCPKEADAAGWSQPQAQLPEDRRGALPTINPNAHTRDVKRMVDEFLLDPRRPLPITRKQAVRIAECWYRDANRDRKPTVEEIESQKIL